MSTPVNFGYAGAYTGYIPSYEASGQLISFTRDPKTFKINDYAQYVSSEKPVGIYAVIDADQPARIVTDDDFSWPDGAEAPAGNDNLLPFVFLDYRCVRKAYAFTLGDEAVDNSDWKVLVAHSGMAQQQAMTARTHQTYLLLNGQVQNGQPAVQAAVNPTAVWGSNYGTPSTLVPNAAGWYSASNDEASPNFAVIKKTLFAAFRSINLQTNAIVQQKDLRLVMGPDDALAISETSEINQYFVNNPFAKAQARGDEPGQNSLWGLPDYLYGFKVVVEDATRVVNRPNLSSTTSTGQSLAMAQGARQYIWQPGTVMLLSRPGGLEGQYGSPSYSTVQIYFYREMEVQTFDDRENERTKGRVVESRAVVASAPAAGYYISGVNK